MGLLSFLIGTYGGVVAVVRVVLVHSDRCRRGPAGQCGSSLRDRESGDARKVILLRRIDGATADHQVVWCVAGCGAKRVTDGVEELRDRIARRAIGRRL